MCTWLNVCHLVCQQPSEAASVCHNTNGANLSNYWPISTAYKMNGYAGRSHHFKINIDNRRSPVRYRHKLKIEIILVYVRKFALDSRQLKQKRLIAGIVCQLHIILDCCPTLSPQLATIMMLCMSSFSQWRHPDFAQVR